MCVTMKLKNVASWQKWLSLVYTFEVKQKFCSEIWKLFVDSPLYTHSKIIFLGYCLSCVKFSVRQNRATYRKCSSIFHSFINKSTQQIFP